ncbi:taurine ABC transporter ATP-binding subunit [Chromobacterium sp. IIBBL 290-4]|uniref:taurine ABC transporter ATP-binding subunit n=1 Tax=Chromobacterium sp. IIBBL 290-4 TaxID=2953890 RepID=UPI0020B724C4|nr:taurine ABC transporter ATP-binding subunit [Chromobacterium sp. IIBBL 290-4]UTH73662.1 taurine ABC transporter ATP-binding subunit [Chromobacterium sp. IIBBL 290-4]
MTTLSARRVSLQYPGEHQAALSDVSLDIEAGELVVALGPSGCGKTSLLNLFAGFIEPSGGQLRFGTSPVRGPDAERAVVFQQHALLPWLDARNNVAFGLRLQGVARQRRLALADERLRQVGLAGAGGKYPWQLSGGQKQRVGIARALAGSARVLLMDEPFGALDAFTREQMQELLLHVWAEAERSVFLITHDIEEALFLATRLVLMSPGPGRIVERLRPGFSQRYRAGESARSIKSSPEFIAQRESLLAAILAGRRSDEEAWA